MTSQIFNLIDPKAAYFRTGANIPVKRAFFTLSASESDQAIVAAVTGKQIVVLRYFINAVAAAIIVFKSGSSAITPSIALIAGEKYVDSDDSISGSGLFETVAGSALNCVITTNAVGGYLNYIEV